MLLVKSTNLISLLILHNLLDEKQFRWLLMNSFWHSYFCTGHLLPFRGLKYWSDKTICALEFTTHFRQISRHQTTVAWSWQVQDKVKVALPAHRRTLSQQETLSSDWETYFKQFVSHLGKDWDIACLKSGIPLKIVRITSNEGTYWTSIHLNLYKEPPENSLLDNRAGTELLLKSMSGASTVRSWQRRKRLEDLQRCTFQGSARVSAAFLDAYAWGHTQHNTNH